MLGRLLIAAVLVLLVPTEAWAAAVPNAGFENANGDGGSGPADWKPDFWGNISAEFTWTTTGHTGRGARVDVKSSSGDGDAKWLGSEFDSDGSDIHYRVSDWYRSDVPTDLILYTAYADGSYAYLSVATLPAAATWTEAKADVAVPDGALSMRVLHTIHNVGYLEIDDVVCVGQDGSALGPGQYQATVTFTFDDGWLSAYNMLIPQLDERGWKATNFIISSYPDKPGYQSDYIGTKHIKSLMDRCHEVTSHTVTHPDLVSLPAEQWQLELANSLKTLQSWGTPSYGVAPPYGSYSPEITAQASKLYTYLRTLHPDINQPPYNLMALNGHVLTNLSTAGELEDLIKRAEHVDGGWVVLVFHRSAIAPPSDAYVSPKQFKGFLEVVAKHNAKVETIAQHLALSSCTEVVAPPPVVGDKSLAAPEAATKATAATAGSDTGCQAGPRGLPPGLLALLGALGWLLVRTKQYRSTR